MNYENANNSTKFAILRERNGINYLRWSADILHVSFRVRQVVYPYEILSTLIKSKITLY